PKSWQRIIFSVPAPYLLRTKSVPALYQALTKTVFFQSEQVWGGYGGKMAKEWSMYGEGTELVRRRYRADMA
ncbi:MAG: hypothetical protein Q4D56_13675, partial [Bacteroides sp.]|nr:hypothetical protein [Bacteroides sp.]